MTTDREEYVIKTGGYGIIRKFSEGTMHKSFTKQESSATTYSFLLTHEFVTKVIDRLHIRESVKPFDLEFLSLPATPLLDSLMSEVADLVDRGARLDPNLVTKKTFDALVAILQANPEAAAAFREYGFAQRPDLLTYMNYNFMYNIPLKVFAKQSGRSLSTFQREFRQIFGMTPHRWLMRKRLRYACDLMAGNNEKPSDVYVRVGFEDLGHFSRAFKREYGVPPSKWSKKESSKIQI